VSKISSYNAITSVQSNDLLVVVDVNDTSMASTGTTKKMTLAQLASFAESSGGPGDWYNVKAYGAAGNGSTDDSAAINSAITAAAVTGGTVYMPEGTYYLGSAPIFNATSAVNNIRLMGAGRGATTIKANGSLTGGTADLIRIVIGTSSTYADSITITGMTLDCTNQTAGNGMTLEGVNNLAIYDVKILNPFGFGISVGTVAGATPYAQNVSIDLVLIQGERNGNDSIGGGGIINGSVTRYACTDSTANHVAGTASNLTNITNFTYRGCYALTTNASPTAGAFNTDFGATQVTWEDIYVSGFKYAVVVSSTSSGQASDILIRGLKCATVHANAIYFNTAAGYGIQRFIITECQIDAWDTAAAANAGFQIYGGHKGTVSNNQFASGVTTAYAIHIAGDNGSTSANPPTYVNFTGNDVSLCTYGFYPQYVDPAGTVSFLDNPGYVTPGTTVNVMNYGALGNGTTNDTTAIQAAITAAGSGGDVLFPYTSGGYLCGALTLPPGVRLIGVNGAFLTAPSSLAASWVKATAAVHNGTAVMGLTFIATAVTSSSCTAIIDFSAVTSCPNIRIEGNRTVNAPVHGIFVSEATYTLGKKWIRENSVEEHGLVAAGFGIYCDYIGSVEIDANYVYTAGADDSIEMGHSGPAYLTINAHLRATNNTVVGGQLQFPFSHYAEILGNTVINNTIQNDANTANYVQIIGNTVINATPAAGYAGIRVAGSYAVISDNRVSVTTGNGIAGTTMVGFAVTGNYVYSSYATSGGTGSAIYDGGSGAIENTITGNVLDGVSGAGFTYAFNLGGQQSAVAGNAVHNGGCFDGVTGTGTYNRFVSNILSVYNVVLIAAGAGCVFRDNQSYNPVGLVTVAVPATTVAVAAQPYDRTFYITTGAGTTTLAISGGPTITAPASGFLTVHVPATCTLTPTYTNAPTWVVEGE
jgi:Pectate lyase superfamily protein